MQARSVTPAQRPRDILEAILLGRFTSEATNGRTIVSLSENGGSTAFTLPEGMGPTDVMVLASEAYKELMARPDPDNPTFGRRVSRLRCAFNKAYP